MFEALELGRKVTKEDFKEEEPGLHTALLATQRRIMEAGIPVIIIIAGVEGAGKGGAVNLLNKWLDTRGLETHAFWDEPEAARERPRFWRFWTALPARGQVGIMFGSWYTQTIIDRVFDRASDGDFERMLGRIDAFERMLIDDGALIVKFWLHLSKDDQQKRLARDVKEKRMTSPHLKEFADHYDDFIKVCERAIRATDSGYAPWNMVEARNRRFRDLTIGRALLSAMERRLAWEESTDSGSQGPAATGGVHTPVDTVTVLDQVDLSARLEREAYESRLEKYQRRLNQLAWQAHKQNRNTVLVFEGWDAAGKGRDPPRHRRRGRAAVPGDFRRRAHRRGAGASLPVALLAAYPARRLFHHLRPLLVRPGAGRARRGLRRRARVAAGLPGDQRLRGAAGGPRCSGLQVLAAYQPGRTAAALQGTREDAVETAQDHRRGLA